MRSVPSIFHTSINPPGVGGFVDSSRKAFDLIVVLEQLRLKIKDSIDLGTVKLRHQEKGNRSIYVIEDNIIILYFCDRTNYICLSFLLKYLIRGYPDVSHFDEEFLSRKEKTVLNFILAFDLELPSLSSEDIEKLIEKPGRRPMSGRRRHAGRA